jgi:Flp pilus assembly protein TadG
MMQRIWRECGGQSLIEFALLAPMVIVLAFGVTETGWALMDQHVVTKLTREGSNLISRDVTLADAVTAMGQMETAPVDFDSRSRIILTVLKKVGTTGAANYGHIIVYQRHQYGALSAASKLRMTGPAAFGGAPNFEAINSDNNTNLRVVDLPDHLDLINGGHLYVTEIFSTHNRITPLDRFGIAMPEQLYSIAYF